MYPGGCNGNHSFFVPGDLERHYRMVHSGNGESQVGLSQTTGKLATANEVVKRKPLPHINHKATSRNNLPKNDPNTNLILNSSFGSASRSDDSTSAITAPTPNRPMQHALGLVRSFNSAVTHQALKSNPGEHLSGQEVMPIGTTSIHAENTSRKEMPQGTTNEIWKQEMIQSAIKHFGMTREHAEYWALTLPVPTTGTVSNKAQGGSYSWPDYVPHIAEGYASLPGYAPLPGASTPTGFQQDLPSDLRSRKVIERERNGRLPLSARTNEYFLPKNGIDRKVITVDICRYLGNDALVRPGTYESPETRQVHEGYYITAWRPLTTAMVKDLKADSTRYEQDLRATASQGHSRNVALATAVSSSRQYYGPTESPSGLLGSGTYTHPTSSNLASPELGTRDSQGYDSADQYPESGNSYCQSPAEKNYVSGANMKSIRPFPSALQLASRAPASRPKISDAVLIDYMGGFQHSYTARKLPNEPLALWVEEDSIIGGTHMEVNMEKDNNKENMEKDAREEEEVEEEPVEKNSVHSPYGNDGTFISSNLRAFQLWRHAFQRLQEQWAVGAWRSPASTLSLVDSKVAHREADRLLSLLALSEDRPSADIEDQTMLSVKALESVLAISSIIKVMKSTLKFKVGSFVWTWFCSVLGEVSLRATYPFKLNRTSTRLNSQ